MYNKYNNKAFIFCFWLGLWSEPLSRQHYFKFPMQSVKTTAIMTGHGH